MGTRLGLEPLGDWREQEGIEEVEKGDCGRGGGVTTSAVKGGGAITGCRQEDYRSTGFG